MVAGDVPSRRASDADRDRVLGVLRDAAVDGRLSHDSFVFRVDLALRARDHSSLADLVTDLKRSSAVIARLRAAVKAIDTRLTVRRKQYPRLVLPSASRPALLIGRHPSCDLVLPGITVSRLHATMLWSAGEWLITDRASTNGTWVNGRRVWGTAMVRPGDRVRFGRSAFRLALPEPTNG